MSPWCSWCKSGWRWRRGCAPSLFCHRRPWWRSSFKTDWLHDQNLIIGARYLTREVFFSHTLRLLWILCTDGTARIFSTFVRESLDHANLSCLVPSYHLRLKRRKTFGWSWDQTQVFLLHKRTLTREVRGRGFDPTCHQLFSTRPYWSSWFDVSTLQKNSMEQVRSLDLAKKDLLSNAPTNGDRWEST